VIFAPLVSVTTFKTDEEALAIANDAPHGFGDCDRADPAQPAFGGDTQSGSANTQD
jgi:hypothetical protein